MTAVIERVDAVDLHYLGGGSDKVYHVTLAKNDDGTYTVAFAYGRRGSTLNQGSKYDGPSLTKARNAYDKIVSEKTGKGYDVVGSNGVPSLRGVGSSGSTTVPPTRGPKVAPTCPLLPCLAKPAPEAATPMEAAEPYLEDDDWVLQEKYDGERLRILRMTGDVAVTGFNRKGIEVALSSVIQDELQLLALPPMYLLDGEFVNDTFWAFDVVDLTRGAEKGCAEPWRERREKLTELLGIPAADARVQVVRTVEGPAKRRLFDKIKAANGEGGVFKRADAPYTECSGSIKCADWTKVKFVERATCIVLAHNAVSSVEVGLLDAAGELVSVGNVTVPAGKTKPAVDSLLEVEYLYAYKGGSLYQPVLIGPRTDIARDECTFDQLKYKPD